LEVDKSHKFLCYSFLQHVQIELGREATINIAQHRFNVLPLAPCKIRIPEGPSVYLLIRIPQAAYSSKVPFKLPYSYPEQYDRIYWAADSYRHDTIIRALGCFMFGTFLGQKGLKILDEGIHLITQSSLNHILFKGADYNN